MTTLEEFKAAAPAYVAAGAEWLDENEPGWEGRIDLASLDLSNSCRCVLGQVTPEESYTDSMIRIHGLGGWHDLDPMFHTGEQAHAWALAHGFNKPVGVPFDYYEVLDELWITLVKERHDTGNLSG